MNRQFAQKLYYACVDEIAHLQADTLQVEALIKRFGARAVPPNRLLRDLSTLGRSDRLQDVLKRNEDRLAELYEAVEQMEAVFKADSDASMEAFAREMAARMKRGS